MSTITANNLRRALQIQERIEDLQGQLESVLAGASIMDSSESSTAIVPVVRRGRRKGSKSASISTATSLPKVRGRRRSHPLKGRKRPESPSGPLAPAVVSVIKRNGKPMKVNDILAGLEKAGYQWTCADPKKNLYARIYRLKGVRRLREGIFGLG